MTKYFLLNDKNSTLIKFEQQEEIITKFFIFKHSKWITDVTTECVISKAIRYGMAEKIGKFLTQQELENEIKTRIYNSVNCNVDYSK